jgi:CBS domain-containing protein
MKIGDIMARDIVTATPDMSYKDVVQRLVDRGVSALPVVEPDGSLVGIVTEADLVAKLAYPGPRRRALSVLADALSGREHHWVTKARGWTAADVMSRNVETCTPQVDSGSVVRRMLALGIKRMPVLDDDGRLVGIVARHDVLMSLARPDADITADVQRCLTSDASRPDDMHVQFAVRDGKVTLTGDVLHPWDEAIVVAMLKSVEGVVDVVSHLHHREREHVPPPGAWTWLAPARRPTPQ